MAPTTSTTTTSTKGRRARVSRGTLTRDDILRTTVALIEDDPIQPITMERVASALGTRPMSLYTHVRNRDDLMDGAVDWALREWTVPPTDGEAWDDELRAWCASLREFARRYSPLVSEMTRNGRFQPALLARVATLSRCLRRAGLDGPQLAGALRWIPQTVLGAITLELARPEDLRSIADEAAAIYGSLGVLDERDRAELLDVLPYYADEHLDDLFEYTVDRVLDGIRTQTAPGEQR